MPATLPARKTRLPESRTWRTSRFRQEFDYGAVPSLRTEARQKLIKIRPATLGQASRISGVSPADIGILMVWLKRGSAESQPREG